MTLASVESLTQILSGFATSVGIFIAIITYIKQAEKDRAEREYETFIGLDDKYIEFMYKCVENSNLDLLAHRSDSLGNRIVIEYPNLEEFFDEMHGERRKKERALFSALISIFERAYVMYNCRCKDRDDLKRNQFEGWKKCMESYCLHPSFLYEWRMIGGQFDRNFQSFFEELIVSKIKK